MLNRTQMQAQLAREMVVADLSDAFHNHEMAGTVPRVFSHLDNFVAHPYATSVLEQAEQPYCAGRPRQPFALIELAQTASQMALRRVVYFLHHSADFVLQKILRLPASTPPGSTSLSRSAGMVSLEAQQELLHIIKENKVQRIILPANFQFTPEIDESVDTQAFISALQENTALLNIKRTPHGAGMQNSYDLNFFPESLRSVLKTRVQGNQFRFLIKSLKNGAEFLDLTRSDFDFTTILDVKSAVDFITALSKSANLSEVALSNARSSASMPGMGNHLCIERTFWNKIVEILAILPNLSRVHMTWSYRAPPVTENIIFNSPEMRLRTACFLNQMNKISAYRGETLQLGTSYDRETPEALYVDLEFLNANSDECKAFADRFFRTLNDAVVSGNIRNIHFVNFDDLTSSPTMMQSEFFRPLQDLLLSSSLETVRFPEYFYKADYSNLVQISHNVYVRNELVRQWGYTVDAFRTHAFLKNAFDTLSKRAATLYRSIPLFPASLLELIAHFMDNGNNGITTPVTHIRGTKHQHDKPFVFCDLTNVREEFDLSQPEALPALLAWKADTTNAATLVTSPATTEETKMAADDQNALSSCEILLVTQYKIALEKASQLAKAEQPCVNEVRVILPKPSATASSASSSSSSSSSFYSALGVPPSSSANTARASRSHYRKVPSSTLHSKGNVRRSKSH